MQVWLWLSLLVHFAFWLEKGEQESLAKIELKSDICVVFEEMRLLQRLYFIKGADRLVQQLLRKCPLLTERLRALSCGDSLA